MSAQGVYANSGAARKKRSSSAHSERVKVSSLFGSKLSPCDPVAIPKRPPWLSQSLPCQESNAGLFSQELFQAFDVVVVNEASSLACRPLKTVAKSFAHFSSEVTCQPA